MKDKEKQIEEMTRKVCNRYSQEMGRCRIDGLDCDYTCSYYDKAKFLVENGYQKVDKDSVVLSREELEKIINQTKETEKNYYKRVVIPQASKETVEKYNDKVVKIIQCLFDTGQIDFKAKIEFLKENEKILKEFGIGVKEN